MTVGVQTQTHTTTTQTQGAVEGHGLVGILSCTIVFRLTFTIYSLELNIHQQILSDIALPAGPTEVEALYAKDLIASKILRSQDVNDVGGINGSNGSAEPYRPFMVRFLSLFSTCNVPERIQSASTAHCNIAFGELVSNFPEEHILSNIDTLVPVLVDLLHDVPRVDFDRSLSWQGESGITQVPCHLTLSIKLSIDWALPDQLVFSTASALLRISGNHETHKQVAPTAINSFLEDVVGRLMTENCPSLQILFCGNILTLCLQR